MKNNFLLIILILLSLLACSTQENRNNIEFIECYIKDGDNRYSAIEYMIQLDTNSNNATSYSFVGTVVDFKYNYTKNELKLVRNDTEEILYLDIDDLNSFAPIFTIMNEGDKNKNKEISFTREEAYESLNMKYGCNISNKDSFDIFTEDKEDLNWSEYYDDINYDENDPNQEPDQQWAIYERIKGENEILNDVIRYSFIKDANILVEVAELEGIITLTNYYELTRVFKNIYIAEPMENTNNQSSFVVDLKDDKFYIVPKTGGIYFIDEPFAIRVEDN